MHARISFTFFTARAHCCTWSTWYPSFFCKAGWSSHIMGAWACSSPDERLCSCPHWTEWHPCQDHFSILLRVLCRSVALPGLVSSANLLGVPPASSPRSFMKILNRIGPGVQGTSYCPQTIFCMADYHSLNLSAKTLFNPPHYLLIQSILHQLLHEDLMKYSQFILGHQGWFNMSSPITLLFMGWGIVF